MELEVLTIGPCTSKPLHTWVKGHDHAIVRDVDSHLKVVSVVSHPWLSYGSPEFAPSIPLVNRLTANSSKQRNIIHTLPCKNPRRLVIHKHFFGPLVDLPPPSVNELGRSRPIRPMRDLETQPSRASSLVREVVLTYTHTLRQKTCGKRGEERDVYNHHHHLHHPPHHQQLSTWIKSCMIQIEMIRLLKRTQMMSIHRHRVYTYIHLCHCMIMIKLNFELALIKLIWAWNWD
jgi:hypothetical protein